jgi:hypothetical protein
MMNEQDVVREFGLVKSLTVPPRTWEGDKMGVIAERYELSREVLTCAACTGVKGSRDYGPEFASGVGRLGHVTVLGDVSGPLSRAVGWWRGDLGREVGGHVCVWPERDKWVLPIFDATTHEAAEALDKLCAHAHDAPNLSLLGIACVKCGGYMTEYDMNGVAWCAVHARKYKIQQCS